MKMQTRVRLGVSAILFVLLPRGCGALQLHSPAQHKTASTAGTHASAAPTDTTLINPGKSVGALRLGDTRERVLEIFPFKLHMDEEYSYKDPCPITEIHWLDRELDADGVFVYLENGRVFQIEAATPRYRTAEGITIHSSPTKVQWHYAHLRAYVLRNSGADIVGGRDLIYWVERQQGIAFELYYDRAARKRLVHEVIVFQPGTEFQPDGCLRPPQEWLELEPFSLEPPSTTTKRQPRLVPKR